MAIDTTNEKLSLLEWDQPYEPGLPLSPGTLGQDDKQQLIWGLVEPLFATAAGVDNTKLAFMEWCLVWEPALPTNPGTFDQGEKQHLIWGYPDVLWGAAVADTSGTRRQRQMKSLIKKRRGRRCR